jgi:4-aminobutyrate aminotransferase-like enzyme
MASLKIIDTEDLCRRAEILGAEFEDRALRWQQQWPIVGDVRRLGAMCALEFVRSTQERTPAELETKKILDFCHRHGVIVISAGTFGNVIRLLMPLVITDAQLNEALDVLEAGIASVTAKGAEKSERTVPRTLVRRISSLPNCPIPNPSRRELDETQLRFGESCRSGP